MNEEVQKITIAKECGWREAFPAKEKPHPETKRGGILLPYNWVNEQTHQRAMELPDYLNDLNAMHGAEKALKEDKADLRGTDERCCFITHLGKIIDCWSPGNHHNSLFQLTHATAAQRAEAFLRAKGLWKDESI